MSVKDNSEIIANANSKQLLTDYYSNPYIDYGLDSSGKIIPQPDFVPKIAFSIIQNDPVVKGALIKKVDKVLESGWRISGIDGRSRKVALERQLTELRFAKVLRKILFNSLLYNNAFIEIVKRNGQVTDLNILEPNNIDIITKPNGDVLGYKQKGATNSNGDIPSWSTEQIWHFKLDDISCNVWAEFDMKALYQTVLLKEKVRDWLYWYFRTNQSKGLFNIKNASDKSVRDFISYLKASENDPGKPIILEGEIDYQVLRKFSDEGQSLMQLLDWCDGQILSLLQVPPLAVGKMDQSGRSNATEAYSAMYTSIYAIQELLEDDISLELFSKIGFPKCKFEFGIIDYVNEERVFKIVGMMKQSGFKDEIIAEWLATQGLQFETLDIFKEEIIPQNNNGPQVQSDNAPSRQRKSSDSPNKSYATPTTRDDQIVRNSEWPQNVKPNPFWEM